MDKWELRKLTDLAEYVNGYPFAPDDWGTEGLPIVRIEQLKNPNAPTNFYAGKLPEKNIIEEGDLIFSWSASLFLRIWKNGRAALNQHLFKVVEKPGVNREFLKSFIEFYLPELTKASHGSTMQHITRKELEKFSAHFPIDESEQEKITFVIAEIDRAIEQTEALIAKQQRIKTGLMQDLLTKGIDEHGNIRTEATHPFKDSPLGRIPVEWDVFQVENVLTENPKNGYSPKESESFTGTVMLGLGCLTVNGFSPVQLKNAPADDPRVHDALLNDGDFLISRSNTRELVGLIGIYKEIGTPCVYPDLMVRLHFDNSVSSEFMAYAFHHQILRLQITGAAVGTSESMVKINSQVVKSCRFLRPPRDEQKLIVKILGESEAAILKMIVQLEKLHLLKRGLLHDLLTGKVRVTDLLNSEDSNP